MSRKRGKNGSTFDPILTHAANPVKMGTRGHFVPFWQSSAKIGKICRRFSNFAANGSSFWVDSKMLPKIKRVIFNFVDLPFFDLRSLKLEKYRIVFVSLYRIKSL